MILLFLGWFLLHLWGFLIQRHYDIIQEKWKDLILSNMNVKFYPTLVGLVVMGVEFGWEDSDLIPCNCDERALKSFDVITHFGTRLIGLMDGILVVKQKKWCFKLNG